ncbi:hypothetical protein L7F22_068389 [Adiantum nelumboides]|nr:hypothetical protein [Adiantum nelumboides]
MSATVATCTRTTSPSLSPDAQTGAVTFQQWIPSEAGTPAISRCPPTAATSPWPPALDERRHLQKGRTEQACCKRRAQRSTTWAPSPLLIPALTSHGPLLPFATSISSSSDKCIAVYANIQALLFWRSPDRTQSHEFRVDRPSGRRATPSPPPPPPTSFALLEHSHGARAQEAALGPARRATVLERLTSLFQPVLTYTVVFTNALFPPSSRNFTTSSIPPSCHSSLAPRRGAMRSSKMECPSSSEGDKLAKDYKQHIVGRYASGKCLSSAQARRDLQYYDVNNWFSFFPFALSHLSSRLDSKAEQKIRHFQISSLYLIEPFEELLPSLFASIKSRGPAFESKTKVVPVYVENRGALSDMGVQQGTFDTVVLVQVLCSIRDPGAHLAYLQSLLKPGGQLLIVSLYRLVLPCLVLLPSPNWLTAVRRAGISSNT